MTSLPGRLRYHVAIFDLDGTLADTLPLIYLAFNDALRPALGRELADHEIRAMFGPPDTAIMHSAAPPGEAEAAIARYMDRYRRDHGAYVTMYDGMQKLLRDARSAGMRLAVVTGKSRVTALYSLEQLGVLDCFEVIYAGDDVERQKPDPQALLAVLDDLGVAPDRSSVMIGDSAADVLAGQAAGLATIAVLWGNPDHHELDSLHPDAVCSSISELREALGLGGATEMVDHEDGD